MTAAERMMRKLEVFARFCSDPISVHAASTWHRRRSQQARHGQCDAFVFHRLTSMKKFKILVHGENLNVYLDGELVRAGFYVTRVVSANTVQQAEKTVLDELANLPKLREHMVHDPNDPPTFNVEEIEEIDGAHPLEEKPSGLVFYKMELH